MTLLLLACTLALAQDVDGFAEVRLQAYAGVDGAVPLFAVERFRPSFSAPLGERIMLATTIEAGLGQGWTTQSAFADLAQRESLDPVVLDALAATDESNDLFRISQANDYLAVDRLTLEFQWSAADLRLGRQALNWGSGFAVNPSDPFPEVLLTEPWKPRSGMNAARLDIPIGDLHGVQLVAGSDDAFLHPRLAARGTVNLLETDWSVVGAWREEIDEGIVGIDVKGTLGVGFWFEGVAHLPAGEPTWEEFAAGLDYSLPVLESLILTAQYYRNGSGGSAGPGPSLFDARQPFAPAFSGRDYLMAAIASGLTPDLSVSALWLHNLGDGTAFFVPSVAVMASGRIDVSLAAQIPAATAGPGEFKPSPRQLTVDLPAADGTLASVDLAGLVPDTTFILWSRFNF
ncbi:MAG: hypothetical protein ACI8PZ_002347 [Myxococcota bacterium]